ncbi:MAG: glutamate--cysteine ligase [Halomonadaceae bacterium]|nr:MAG: glutamate--cysteine ligase [Halomonadaceae bacterium]
MGQRLAAFNRVVAQGWDGFLKGVEKEGLRVDSEGFIAQTPHPKALGSALTHPAITTDYSEALLELITPVCNSTAEVMESLTDIHSFVQMHLGDEVLWSASMPCRIKGEESIPIAEYGTSNVGQLKYVYRHGLAVRYGRVMQSIAGVHYNFSMPESFWQRWQQQLEDSQPLQDFKTEQYFWLIRNFRRRSWLLMLLFGSSPALDASFVCGRKHNLRDAGPSTLKSPLATSLRMSDMGYNNQAQSSLNICFNRLETFTRTLDRAIHTPWPPYEEIGLFRGDQRIQINTNVLQIENEYYSAMRPKRTTRPGEKPLHALEQRGVEYVEVRCLDLDPFSPVGMTPEQLDFLDLFLLDCLLNDGDLISDEECDRLDNAFRDVVASGRDPSLRLCDKAGTVTQVAQEYFNRLAELADTLPDPAPYHGALESLRPRLQDPQQLPSARVLTDIAAQGEGFVAWNLALSRQHQRQLRERGLAPSLLRTMEQQAQASLQQQAELESAETESFEDFLANYLAE